MPELPLPILAVHMGFRTDATAGLPPYTGGLWRSALGMHLRRRACITGAPDCKGCRVARHCAYGDQYDTPAPARAGQLSARYPDPPHPYVLSPGGSAGEPPSDGALALDLILVGRAARYLPDWLAVTREVALDRCHGERDVLGLIPLRPDAPAQPVAMTDLLDAQPRCPPVPSAPERVRVHLEHPLRLRCRNRYVGPEQLTFAVFFNTLTRRISMLHEREYSCTPQQDFRALSEHARQTAMEEADLHWFGWHRYSARQKRRIPMGGLLGTFTVSGDLSSFWPWLWLGQWLHVGKGAVMGLGRYRLEVLA